MKTYELSMNHWFIKMLSFLSGRTGWFYENQIKDSCDLARHTLACFFFHLPVRIIWASLIVAAVTGMLYAMGMVPAREYLKIDEESLKGILVSILCGVLIVVACIIIVVCLLGVIAYIIDLLEKHKAKKEPKPPGPVGLMLNNFKEKTCSKVTIK